MRFFALVFMALLGTFAATADAAEVSTEIPDLLKPYLVAQAFDCSDVSCKRLRSCEEACFKLLQRGQRVRDGDDHGIPCENLCSRPC
ncbi:hypothetical protein [Roseivivax sediminis]|uniref:Excalibur calcium-binding domain-containing protein n=1 Tax=Roseivivax sediminis TaxID=936889 RepID=A0A1I1WZE5_9RHOB|nr:hypothetical protein [Roseivivax sediminis]SFE00555.1 hypothetical protein SAMN04515678_105172 [Roseivivax sediminis]